MPASTRRQRRLLLPISIAVLLAAETSAATLAFQPSRDAALDSPVTTVPAAAVFAPAPAVPSWALDGRGGDDRFVAPAPAETTLPRIRLIDSTPPAPVAAPKPRAAAPVAPKPAAAKPAATYSGRNHVWIPSLGINRAVAWFPCSRSKPPGHLVYRWGCAGANNVYLFGHASSVMKPLHDAYVRGRLRKGMAVWYADANGKVRKYTVSYWRVVRPDGDIGWAFAAQSRPSLTLQTCVGANSQYRLVVRLVAR